GAAVTSVAEMGRLQSPEPATRALPNRIEIPAEGFETSAAPSRRTAVRVAPAAESKESPESLSYTVQKGDTLYSIATQHGTTVDAIRRLNRMGARALLR